ncbi:Hydroxymethylpyrimidine phosphate kinase ThiD [hydrothermal vent metagenome]|uniref:Hydroxymethylpyrimidine phosphate kinase ThiD n=1 Tax=hydrothermal vent metagenome TaxID=652676 RepID=A0A3B0WV96_9ZZZZ
MIPSKPPVVLCFSGLDPTGGAGIQADIEAIGRHGCHAAAIITANTLQDTHNVIDFTTLDPTFILKQARALLKDMPVSVIKIGMLGSGSVAEAVYTLLREHRDIPVIYDPILSASGGSSLAHKDLIDAVKSLIIPHTHILTPNIPEALHLTSTKTTPETAAQHLNNMGAKYVLLTGTHANSPSVIHKLYTKMRCEHSFTYKRLENEFHGSGCTLAASLAALTAQKIEPINACQNALDFTFKALSHAQALGTGQLIPDRHHV